MTLKDNIIVIFAQYMLTSTISKTNSTIFKTLKNSINDIAVVGSTLTRIGELRLDPTNISGYATALQGLTTQQAQLLMSTNGLSYSQQQLVLSQIRLATTTGTLTTQQMANALITETRNEADAKALLLNAGLITSETAEATAIHTVTAAKLRELVQTEALTQAEANLLASKAGVTLASQQQASVFSVLGTKLKIFGNSLKALAVGHPILTAITVAIGVITTAVTIAEKKNKEFIESQEEIIEKSKESISEYESEIASLDSLQTRLQEAKGNKEVLATIQGELNDTIGNTVGLLDAESKGYDIANQKLVDRINTLKELKQAELDNKVTAQKAIFDNSKVSNSWGIDHKFDYFADHEIIASDAGEAISWDFMDYVDDEIENKYMSLQDIFKNLKKNNYGSGENGTEKKSNAEIWNELIASYGGANLDTSEIQEFFNNQTKYAQDILSDYISSSESIFSNEQLNSMIQDLVEGGYAQDLEGVEEVITSLVENDELESTIDEYYESLGNKDIDSDALYQNIKSQFDVLIEKYPQLKSYLETFFNNISTDIQSGMDVSSSLETAVSSTPKTFDYAWDSLLNTDEEELEGAADAMLELATAGKLTTEAFAEMSGASKLLNDTGLSTEKLTKKINSLVDESTQLSALKDAIGSIQDAYTEKEENGVVSSATLSSMSEEFGDLGKVWENYKQTVGDTSSTLEDCRKVQDELATAYVNSNNFLSNLDESTKEYYISQLSELGIANAEEVVLDILTAKQEALAIAKQFTAQTGTELANATADEINKFAEEQGASSSTIIALNKLALEKELVNGTTLSFESDIQNIIDYVEKIGSATTKLRELAYAKQHWVDNSAGVSGPNLPTDEKGAQEEVDDAKNKDINVDYKVSLPTSNQTSKSNSSNSDTTKKETKETIDWIERALERMTSKIDIVQAKFENLFTVKKKNSNLQKQINMTNKLIKMYETAEKKYAKKASNVDLKDSLKKAVQEGRIGKKTKLSTLIATYGEKKAQKIQKYQEYYDLSKEAKQNKITAKTEKRNKQEEQYQLYVDEAEAKIARSNAKKDIAVGYKKQNKYLKNQKKFLEDSYKYQIEIAKLTKDKVKQAQLEAELEKELRALEVEKFENIETDFDNQISLIEAESSSLEAQMSLIEAKGDYLNAQQYQQQIAYEQQTKALLEQEKSKLEAQLQKITAYTDEWYDAKNAIADVNSEIQDCDKSIVEMNQSITEIADTFHSKMVEALSKVSSDMEYVVGLMSNKDLFDSDTHMITEEGLATLQSYLVGIETSRASAEHTKKLYDELSQNRQNGVLSYTDADGYARNYSSPNEMLEKELELEKELQELNTQAYEYESKAIDVMTQKLENELELMQDLISSKKEAMDAEKDLYEYSKSIRESTKNISQIQMQISALQGDTSDETTARIQKLQKELADEQESLADKEYERQIADEQEMLDNMYDQYSDLINSELKDVKKLLSDAYTTVNSNLSTINQTIANAITDEGLGYMPTNVSSILSATNGVNGTASDISTAVKSLATDIGTQVTNIMNNNPNNTTASTGDTSGSQTGTTAETTASTSGTDNTNAVEASNFGALKKKGDVVDWIQDNKKKGKKNKYKSGGYSYVNEKIYDLTNGYVLSTDNLKLLAELVGVTYDNAKKGGRLAKKLKALKVKGFSRGGIVSVDSLEKQIKANGDTTLISANPGEEVLTPYVSKAFRKLVDSDIIQNPEFLNSFTKVNVPNFDAIANTLDKQQNTSTTNISDVSFNFELPNVTDSKSMLHALQTDKSIQKTVQDLTIGQMNKTASRLSSNRFK